MPAPRIRIVTFAINHPATAASLRLNLAAWSQYAGHHSDNLRFTVMLPETPDNDCLEGCAAIMTNHPVDLIQVPANTASLYGCYWPLSFLDLDYDDDLIIYSPPNTLVANDIAPLIDSALSTKQLITSPYLDDYPAHGMKLSPADYRELMSMWFVAIPREILGKLHDVFPETIRQAGYSETTPPATYHEIQALLSSSFSKLVREQQIPHQILPDSRLHQLHGKSALAPSDHPAYAHMTLWVNNDSPDVAHPWGAIFQSSHSFARFLDDGSLASDWLYYQRDLRRIFNKQAGATNPSLYRTNKHPYYIFALDYIQQSAGTRALHYLCHALNEVGQEAYVTCMQTNPLLRTPVLNSETMMQHRNTGRTPIMVYPEIVSGDPLAAGGIVVRWLLNQPGHIAGDLHFPPDNLIFTYDPSYLPMGMHGEPLHLPTSDLSIFNNDNNPYDSKRELVCFYAHKYLTMGGQLTEHVKGATSLCKDQKLTHPELAAILRRSKLLYVYEPTALIEEALLCGCPVSIIETNYWRENMNNHSYSGNLGVVMDDSPTSLAQASSNVKQYRSIHEKRVTTDAWNQIDRFIELTQRAIQARSRAI